MKFHFYKYQATGNDFVIVDNRAKTLAFSKEQVEKVCDRRFGVGADGLMLIEPHPEKAFDLVYYNSDGSQSLCGNGSRAAVHFARRLGLVADKATFNAYDGTHEAELLQNGLIRLKMNDVTEVRQLGEDLFINTGSPHYLKFVDALEQYPVVEQGRMIRYRDDFKPGGTNANFLQILPDNTLFVRTYERGVENETLSCGTGVTAAALAAHFKGLTSPVRIKALGGDLSVEFKYNVSGQYNRQAAIFTDIFLIGPAKMVFEGDLDL